MDRKFCKTDIKLSQKNLLKMMPWCPKKDIRSLSPNPVLGN